MLYMGFSPDQMTPVVHSTGIAPTVTLTPNPIQNTLSNMQRHSTNNARAPSNHQAPREKEHFDPLPYSYKEIYNHLLASRLVAPVFLDLTFPPYPSWYNVNASYEYHAGA